MFSRQLLTAGIIALCLSACATTNSDYSLKELNFSQKQLEHLPSDLSAYTQLQRLYADANNISNIPDKVIGNWPELQELDLSYNQLEALPDKISQAKNLEVVDLSFNKFKHFPKALLKLEKLRTLDIRNNEIKELPEEIKNLKKLEIVYLAGNELDQSKRALYRSWLPRTKFIWVESKTEQ